MKVISHEPATVRPPTCYKTKSTNTKNTIDQLVSQLAQVEKLTSKMHATGITCPPSKTSIIKSIFAIMSMFWREILKTGGEVKETFKFISSFGYFL